MPRLSPSSHPHDAAEELSPKFRPSLTRYALDLIAHIQRNQGDVDAIELLAAHYAEAEDQASLVNLLEGWGDTLGEPAAAADAYVRAADAALIGLQDRERARELYERALSREASHAEALDRVLRVLEDDRNVERQKQILKFVAFRLGETTSEPVYHASVYYRLGQVYETHFAEPGKAAASYRSAIERNPSLIVAIVGARRLYQAVGNARAVAALYEFEIEATPVEDNKRLLLLSLADIQRHELGDLDGAVAVLRRALHSAPGDLEALRMLGEVLVARSERTDKPADSVDRKRAAEVFFQLGRALPTKDAHAYLQRALQLCPEHERAAKLVYELGSREPVDDNKTQLIDLEELQSAEVVPSEPEPAHAAADGGTSTIEHALTRDSAEAWLTESEPHSNALGTGELLPLELNEQDGLEVRPSSLPPRALERGVNLSLLMPSHEALRAPRVPPMNLSPMQDPRESAEIPVTRPRRTVPPPPPSAAHRPSPRPVAPSAAAEGAATPSATPRPSAPPPAYAEIPGESGEHFTPVRGHHARGRSGDDAAPVSAARRDPTLPAWRTERGAPAVEDERPSGDTISEALTPVMHALPPVKPQYDLPSGDNGAATRLAALAVTSTQPATGPAPIEPGMGEAAARVPSRMHAVQNERFADLARTALGGKATVASSADGMQPSAAGFEVNDGAARVTADEPSADAAVALVEVELSALSDSSLYVGADKRVSGGGLFVATFKPLARGAHVELRVSLPAASAVRALGQVWRVRGEVEPFSDEVPGMWVRLTAVSEPALQAFERFANQRAPMIAVR